MASIANAAGWSANSTTTTNTRTLVVSAGTNRRAIAIACCETGSETIDSATFDGNAMTPLAASVTFGGIVTRAFEYLIPDVVGAATYDIVVTKSGAVGTMRAQAIQIANAHASTASAITSTTTGTGTDQLVVVSAVNGVNNLDALVATYTNESASTTATATSSEVTLGNFQPSGSTFNSRSYTAIGDATETVTVTWTLSNTTSSKTGLLIVTPTVVVAPTITVQPVAQTKVLTNANTATFSVTATGTGGLTHDWELENGVASGVYADVADGNGATWTGRTTTSLVGTFTAKTLSGRRVRCNVTDSNGTTTSTAVALTLFDGPQLTTFPATNGSGVSTATLTCDYVTGVGEAIEVRIPLSDGDVAVTVTTT